MCDVTPIIFCEVSRESFDIELMVKLNLLIQENKDKELTEKLSIETNKLIQKVKNE